MAATQRTSSTSRNGSSGAPAPIAKVKEAGESVASAGARAKGPLIAAGAGVAGLAGGLALGRRLYRPRGFTGAFVTAAQALARTAEAGDEVRQVREQLSRANRRSPVEVLLDGLTHRRGAHRAES
jgi:hypothetical protein